MTSARIPAGYRVGRVLLDAAALATALDRLTDEILARNPTEGGRRLAMVGIRRGGVHLARRIADRAGRRGRALDVGTLDITMYRDDLNRVGPNPIVGSTDIEFDIDEATVVLVDDVLFSGRTVRAALDALVDYGRPRGVQLAVLVDRGHRELPIQPDFVALTVKTSDTDQVEVQLDEEGASDQAVLLERGERS